MKIFIHANEPVLASWWTHQRGIITFPETFQSPPFFQLEEEIAFPSWENLEDFDCFLLFSRILGMYRITSFQHLPKGLVKSTECLAGMYSILQLGSVTTGLDWMRMLPSPKQWRKSCWSTVDHFLLLLCFFLSLRFKKLLGWEKTFIFFKTESNKKVKWAAVSHATPNLGKQVE